MFCVWIQSNEGLCFCLLCVWIQSNVDLCFCLFCVCIQSNVGLCFCLFCDWVQSDVIQFCVMVCAFCFFYVRVQPDLIPIVCWFLSLFVLRLDTVWYVPPTRVFPVIYTEKRAVDMHFFHLRVTCCTSSLALAYDPCDVMSHVTKDGRTVMFTSCLLLEWIQVSGSSSVC